MTSLSLKEALERIRYPEDKVVYDGEENDPYNVAFNEGWNYLEHELRMMLLKAENASQGREC